MDQIIKLKKSHYIFFVVYFICISCKTYKRTVKVCDETLFVEAFITNPMGLQVQYLTDSTNFRLYLGEIEEEHEDFVPKCIGDTLIIYKYGMEQLDTVRHVLEAKAYSISKLKFENKFE